MHTAEMNQEYPTADPIPMRPPGYFLNCYTKTEIKEDNFLAKKSVFDLRWCTVFLHVCLVYVTATFWCSAEDALVLTGESGYSVAQGATTNMQEVYRIRFVLTLAGPFWRADLRSSAGNFRQLSTLAYDGTNVYGLAQGSGGTKKMNARGDMKRFDDAGYIKPGPFPDSFGMFGAVWWVFMSDNVYSNKEDRIIDVFGVFGPGSDAKLVRTFDDPVKVKRIGVASNKLFGGSWNASPIPLLYTQVLLSTNFSGTSVATSVVIDQYDTLDGASRLSPRVLARYFVKINEIKPSGETKFRPEIRRTTLINDYRPLDKTGILRSQDYLTTNWLSAAEALPLTHEIQ